MFECPAILALLNVMLNCFSGDIANRSVEFPCRPEMVFPKESVSDMGKFMQNPIRRDSLKQLHNFTYGKTWCKANKQMHMIRLDFKSMYLEIIAICYAIKSFLTKLFNSRIHEIFVSAFGCKD